MKYQHQELKKGSWFKLNLLEQLANIGSEVERAIKWKSKNNFLYSQLAFFRALELLDLTTEDSKNRSRLREIIRLREVLADYFYGSNTYHSSDKKWQKYFFSFTYASRLSRL